MGIFSDGESETVRKAKDQRTIDKLAIRTEREKLRLDEKRRKIGLNADDRESRIRIRNSKKEAKINARTNNGGVGATAKIAFSDISPGRSKRKK